MEKKLLLVDGNSLLYRAFFALPPLSHKGVPLNAIHGFFTMLLKAVADHKPSAIFVMFDEATPTFRHQEYDAYKAGRPPAPDDLKIQFGLIREFLQACHLPVISQAGFEADDLLGTASKLAEAEGVSSIILTGDRDALQLATDKCSILITKKGISESLLLDPEGVKANYGVYPNQITDLKGLMGDSSDNIPGVPGVGEKTAIKLLDEYGSIENLLENAEGIKGKLGEKIRANTDVARFSKKLATIICTAPMHIDVHSDNVKGMQSGLAMLQEYRLNRVSLQLKALYEGENAFEVTEGSDNHALEIQVKEIQSGKTYDAWHLVSPELSHQDAGFTAVPEKLEELAVSSREALSALHLEGVEILSMYPHKNTDCLSLFTDKGLFVKIAIKRDLLGEGLPLAEVMEIVLPKIQGKKLIVHGQKEFLSLVDSLHLRYTNHIVWDSMVANYVLESSAGEESLASIVGEEDAHLLYTLAVQQYHTLQKADMLRIASDCEFPLSRVLHAMEKVGFLTDREVLFDLQKFFQSEINRLENAVYEETGFFGFNLNSPKQLSEILFERMNLPHGKKTKSGSYSTNAEALEKLVDKHPVIQHILDYRKFTKLNSTYIDSLLKLTKNTPRVHTRFDQTGTVTGRISSLDPNLQNIPIRSKEGAEIRKAFVASEGSVLIDADYSQIELRVLAHLSQDSNLIKAFQSGKDIHSATASEIFEVPIEKVDATMRSNAKAVNFGLVYGISSFGLARNTNISFKEAEKFISMYFDRYPGVWDFMDDCVERGEKDGAIYTLFNRRRALPEIQSRNQTIKAFGKRIAMNTPVQGTAADIIKLAMIIVAKKLEAIEGAELILQVHDELIIECKEDLAEQVSALLKESMENIVKLAVPLVVEVHTAKSWYESK